jgi:hypothetical protein
LEHQFIKSSETSTSTWLATTTTENGESKTSIRPIIWCSDCGGGSTLIKIPKLPEWGNIDIGILPTINFNLPGILSFTIPCIPMPGVKSCSSPPGGGGKGKTKGKDGDKNDGDKGKTPDDDKKDDDKDDGKKDDDKKDDETDDGGKDDDKPSESPTKSSTLYSEKPVYQQYGE